MVKIKESREKMKTYICEECGDNFSKGELNKECFDDDSYFCKGCASSLAQAGWDAVDPDHNFDSYSDWDERGR